MGDDPNFRKIIVDLGEFYGGNFNLFNALSKRLSVMNRIVQTHDHVVIDWNGTFGIDVIAQFLRERLALLR